MSSKLIGRTAYEKKERFHCPEGSRLQPIYEYVIDNKGRKVLEQTGEKDIYLEIQADLEECKIENILARVAVGDMSDFRPNGIYADTTEIPNNMIEAMKQIQNLQNIWADVPNDIKAKYNFDVNQYIADAGSEAWLINNGYINKNVDEITPTAEATAPEIKTELPKGE